jgi:hypothetical protein
MYVMDLQAPRNGIYDTKNNKTTKPKKGKTHASHAKIKSFFHAIVIDKR